MRKNTKRTVKRKNHANKKANFSVFLKVGFRLLPYVLFIFLSLLLYKAGRFVLLESDYFTIKNIAVISNDTVQNKSVINKRLNASKGNNIFSQDLKELENSITRLHPEVKDVIVQRLLPDTITVSYEQRKPIGQIESGYYYLVSDDAIILPDPKARQQAGLIVISGLKVPGGYATQSPAFKKALMIAIQIIKDIHESGFSRYQDRIVKINIFDIHNPALFLDDDTRIEIGEYSFKDKSIILAKMLDELELKNKKAKVIDLRFEDIVVVPR
jgi:cell division septal protein FtsQ